MRVFVSCDIGNVSDTYEDNYLISREHYLLPGQINVNTRSFSETAVTEDDFCVAISDGMGGYEKGAIASYEIVRYLSDNYDELIGIELDDVEKFKNFFMELNSDFCNRVRVQHDSKQMSATLCGVVCHPEGNICFNSGDSRLYVFKDKELKQISIDNTDGQRLIDFGLLSKEEEKLFINRKNIYKFIGIESNLVVDTYPIEKLGPDDLIIICSDGLSDTLDEIRMKEILLDNTTVEDKCNILVKQALENNAKDNVTVAIIGE